VWLVHLACAAGSQVLFRVRRPAYLINSYMYIEDAQVGIGLPSNTH